MQSLKEKVLYAQALMKKKVICVSAFADKISFKLKNGHFKFR